MIWAQTATQSESYALMALWAVMWLGSAAWLLIKGRRALGIWSIILGWMAPIVPFIIACAAVNKTKLEARDLAIAYAAQVERERQTELLKRVTVTQPPYDLIPALEPVTVEALPEGDEDDDRADIR